jgi:hypothetical protein
MAGLKTDPTYITWCHMKSRCFNKNNERYDDYGGRGITVCKRWLKYSNFLKDMGPKTNRELSLERLNNNKGYSKSNCKWATRKEQCNNRRTSRFINIDGTIKTLAQWCETSDIKDSTIRQRYYGYKWDIKKALGMEV